MRFALMPVLSACMLSGCGTAACAISYINLFDSSGACLPKYKYSAPYGAYFVKQGMTREERLQDLALCGSPNGLEVTKFSKEQIERATIPKEKAAPGELTDGYLILLNKLKSCMKSKGYNLLSRASDACSSNQEYIPRCMWP